MKKSSIIALACIALCACTTQVTEEDYKNALIDYIGQDNIADKSLTLAHTRDITVADSIGYYTVTLATEHSSPRRNKPGKKSKPIANKTKSPKFFATRTT